MMSAQSSDIIRIDAKAFEVLKRDRIGIHLKIIRSKTWVVSRQSSRIYTYELWMAGESRGRVFIVGRTDVDPDGWTGVTNSP
jgi:hypothetical protein